MPVFNPFSRCKRSDRISDIRAVNLIPSRLSYTFLLIYQFDKKQIFAQGALPA